MANDIGLNVGAGIFHAVAHARLGSEMDDPVHALDRAHDRVEIGDVAAHEGKILMRGQLGEPRFLESDIVIVVEVVDTDNRLTPGEQRQADMHTNEPSGTGQKNCHGFTNFPSHVRARLSAHVLPNI